MNGAREQCVKENEPLHNSKPILVLSDMWVKERRNKKYKQVKKTLRMRRRKCKEGSE